VKYLASVASVVPADGTMSKTLPFIEVNSFILQKYAGAGEIYKQALKMLMEWWKDNIFLNRV
jgi:hypothetical protein